MRTQHFPRWARIKKEAGDRRQTKTKTKTKKFTAKNAKI